MPEGTTTFGRLDAAAAHGGRRPEELRAATDVRRSGFTSHPGVLRRDRGSPASRARPIPVAAEAHPCEGGTGKSMQLLVAWASRRSVPSTNCAWARAV